MIYFLLPGFSISYYFSFRLFFFLSSVFSFSDFSIITSTHDDDDIRKTTATMTSTAGEDGGWGRGEETVNDSLFDFELKKGLKKCNHFQAASFFASFHLSFC